MEPDREQTYIEEIAPGQNVASRFLIDDLRLGQTKAGKPFVGLTLRDRTGAMEARVWEAADDFYSKFQNGDVLEVIGKADSFQGKVQLKVGKARRVEDDDIDPSRFLPASKHDPEEMWAELTALINTIGQAYIRGLLLDILNDPRVGPAFKRAPAAKRFHHAYVGGLLEHTLSVVRAADAVCRLYPALHRGVLLAGAVLHDLGKIREFDQGLTGDYTDEGRFLGHLIIGLEIIEEKLAAYPDFPRDMALHLKHLVVSHHGEYEMGSPKRPKTLEALALHHLDDLDAKMNGIGGFIERHVDERTGWTDYNRLMERFFYQTSHEESEVDDITAGFPAPETAGLESVEPEAPEQGPEPGGDGAADRSAASSEEPDVNQLSFLED